MRTLINKLKQHTLISPFKNKKKILKAIEYDSYFIDTFGDREGVKNVIREIKYHGGYIDLNITIEFIEEYHTDPFYSYTTQPTIVGIDVTVYNQYKKMVEHTLTYQEIYKAIKEIENN